ncbi:MAG: hypothetical protein R6V57_01235 [Vicinamibacterales bacterium]
MTASPPAARRDRRLIETSGGEFENERLSRGANAAEALAVFLLLQVVLQSGIGSPPRPGDDPLARGIALAAAVIVGIYAILVAPWLHRDGRHGRGLPEPSELRGAWNRYDTARRLGAVVIVLAVPAVVAGAGWDSLLVRLGVRLTWPALYAELTAPPWSAAGTAVAAAVFGLAIAGLLIRWTNLGSAARAMAWPVGFLLAGIAAAAALQAAGSGDGIRVRLLIPRLAAYVPWALLQQWVLLAYFNTRIRKAVPPAGWGGLPGPFIAAGLTGVAFGSMHWPDAPLASLTCVAGVVSGWLFLRDRSRNLFLLALAHALAGALATALGLLRMGVGPRL